MNNALGKEIVRRGQNKHLLGKCMRLKYLLGLKRKKKDCRKDYSNETVSHWH